MRKIATLLSLCLATSLALATTNRLGTLNVSNYVTTVESDAIALSALAASGTVWRTQWQAYADNVGVVTLSNANVVLVNSGALWTIQWQQAAGASSEVVRVALTNEVAIRTAQDAILQAQITTNALWIKANSGIVSNATTNVVVNGVGYAPVNGTVTLPPIATLSDIPVQTTQVYTATAGTVTGSQSNIIAGAVTNGQASLTINGPGTFGGDLSVGGSLYVVNVTVSNTQVVATNLTVNGVVSNGGYRIAQGGLLYSGGNAVLTNGATVTQGTYADGWHAVSNTVQVGAALGATALQSEVDTLASVTARGNITTGDIQMQYGNSSIWFGNGGLQRIWGGAFDFQIFDGVGRMCADFYNSGISASNFSSTISGKTNAITSSGLVDLSSALGAAGSALQPNGSASGLSGCPSGAVATNDTRYLGSVTNAVGSTSTNVSIWTGTAASYAALTATNANCIYFVE